MAAENQSDCLTGHTKFQSKYSMVNYQLVCLFFFRMYEKNDTTVRLVNDNKCVDISGYGRLLHLIVSDLLFILTT